MVGPREVALLGTVVLTALVLGWAAYRWSTIRKEERLSAALGRRHADDSHGLDTALARLPLLSRANRRIEEAQLPIRVSQVALVWLLAFYPVWQVLEGLYGSRLGLVLALIALPGVTLLILGNLSRRRRRHFAKQSLDLVRHLAGSARAGLSLSHALTTAADELGEPIASELRRVVLDMEFGRLPVVALERFGERSRLPAMDLLVNAIVIQQRSGGDLVALLTRLATGMEDIDRGQTEANAIVAGVRSMPWNVLGLALLALFALNRINEGILDRMQQWPVLELALYLSLGAILLVVPLMQRITRLDETT